MPRSLLESSLWAWLRDGAPRDAVLERVENSAGVGTPDVFGCWRGWSFACELKVWPRELEPEQASFLRRWHAAGGRAWVLWKVENMCYILRAPDCHLALAPMTRAALVNMIRASVYVPDAAAAVAMMAGVKQ